MTKPVANKRVARERDSPEDDAIPTITPGKIGQLGARIGQAPRTPLRPVGSVSKCHECGGRMVTTNMLTHEVPTPRGLVILTRLPGGECETCHSRQYDSAALAIIMEHEA